MKIKFAILAALAVGLLAGCGTAAAKPNVHKTTTPPAPAVKLVTDPNGYQCTQGDEINGYCPGDSPSPSATPTPPPPPPAVVYHYLGDYKWNLIQKDPNSYVGNTYVIYGSITQFDSDTGPTEFRADAGPQDNQNTNTIFDGTNDAAQLAPLVTGDNFSAQVTIEGALTYTTTLGGSITVPEVQVVTITQL